MPRDGQLDQIAIIEFQLAISRIFHADDQGVVPHQLGQRIGRFLQPAVVGEAAIVSVRVGIKAEGETARAATSGAGKFGQLDRGIGDRLGRAVLRQNPLPGSGGISS